MKNILGFLFQFSIHQQIGVAKFILIVQIIMRYYFLEKNYFWLLNYIIKIF